jgi:hypothetical protein
LLLAQPLLSLDSCGAAGPDATTFKADVLLGGDWVGIGWYAIKGETLDP